MHRISSSTWGSPASSAPRTGSRRRRWCRQKTSRPTASPPPRPRAHTRTSSHPRPATSIHVSPHEGGSAHPISVELFLTYVADFKGAPESPMGIRETCEAPPREACTDAPGAVALQPTAASQAACGPGPDVAQVGGAKLGGRALAPTLAPLAVEQVQSPASVLGLLGHWQLARSKALAAKAQSQKSRSSISSSSRTSSSSAGTSTQEGCVSAVCLRVDTSSWGLRVEEMPVCFEIGHQQPRLKDWLPKEPLDEIMRNFQELVNQREYGDSEDRRRNS
ncbi:unnamed protein product [Prorocentrum cordatum]|uniref:Uncharacterized protein n=1 Tax=Prorocentrum cordatum TaxID=2364126 RepID=A0ABN9S067_9DINO|nr:unnamed protein product [Polarella glacialis]